MVLEVFGVAEHESDNIFFDLRHLYQDIAYIYQDNANIV